MTDPITLSALALAAMLALAPTETHRPPPGWQEAPEAIRARYEAIAADVGAVAQSREDVALLVGVAWHESGFAADVDAGRCYQIGKWRGRCDGGRAVSLWQLQSGAAESRERWRTDRRAAATRALAVLRWSLRTCGGRLTAYASGSCSKGHQGAAELAHYVARVAARLGP